MDSNYDFSDFVADPYDWFVQQALNDGASVEEAVTYAERLTGGLLDPDEH